MLTETTRHPLSSAERYDNSHTPMVEWPNEGDTGINGWKTELFLAEGTRAPVLKAAHSRNWEGPVVK